MGDENTGGNGCWSLAQNGLWGRETSVDLYQNFQRKIQQD